MFIGIEGNLLHHFLLVLFGFRVLQHKKELKLILYLLPLFALKQFPFSKMKLKKMQFWVLSSLLFSFALYLPYTSIMLSEIENFSGYLLVALLFLLLVFVWIQWCFLRAHESVRMFYGSLVFGTNVYYFLLLLSRVEWLCMFKIKGKEGRQLVLMDFILFI